MADAQVRSAERRGEIKTINSPDYELFGATDLDTTKRIWFISYDYMNLETLVHVYVSFLVSVLHTLV